MIASISAQLPTSRLLAYSVFSSFLILLALWRLYFRFPDININEENNGNNALSNSKVTFDLAMQDSFVVIAIFNMILSLIIVSIKMFQHTFFGPLVGTESQYIREKLTRFALFHLVFLVGVINATSWSSLLGWTLWFCCLGTLYGFSRLAHVRGEQLVVANNITKWQWVRFLVMLFLLFSGIVTMLHTGVKCCFYLSDVTPETDLLGFVGSNEKAGLATSSESEETPSGFTEEHTTDYYQLFHVLLFMLSDCAQVTLILLQVVSTVAIHFIDSFELLGERFGFSRTIWLYYINLFFDMSGIFLDLTNHLHMLIWSRGISLTSIIVILQFRVTYVELNQRIQRHSAHKKLIKFVRQQFPVEHFNKKVSQSSKSDGDDYEEQVPESCAICWEQLVAWRKLPCGHCFHENCLIQWMEQNLSCPTCRRILSNNNTVPTQQQQGVQGPQSSLTAIASLVRDMFGMVATESRIEAVTEGAQIGTPGNSPLLAQSTSGPRITQMQPANNNQTIFRLARLPTVRAMAVRLRQHGGEGPALVDNPGPRLDLSIRVSVSPGTPLVRDRRTRYVRSSSTDRGANSSVNPDVSSQDSYDGQTTGTTITNVTTTTTTTTEDHQPQRHVVQSTIQSRFFRFDGSRYFSWLPNISIEFFEIFGELINSTNGAEIQEGRQPTILSEPPASSGTEQISQPPMPPPIQRTPPSPITSQEMPSQPSRTTSESGEATHRQDRDDSFVSRILSAFLSPGEGIVRARVHRVPHRLGPELRRQANEIQAMFPNISLDQILADLALTGQAEATVDNILSGQLQRAPVAQNITIPSEITSPMEPNVELRQRRPTIHRTEEQVEPQPFNPPVPPPRRRVQQFTPVEPTGERMLQRVYPPFPFLATTEPPSQSSPQFPRSPESIQRAQRRRQLIIEGKRKFRARLHRLQAVSIHQPPSLQQQQHLRHQRPDGDNLHS